MISLLIWQLQHSKDRDDTLNQLFNEYKQRIVQDIEDKVKTFEVNRPTWLTMVYSRNGSGFLFQKYCRYTKEAGPNCGEDHWKLIPKQLWTEVLESLHSATPTLTAHCQTMTVLA